MGCSLPVVLHKEVIGTFKKERRKRLEVQQPSEFRKEVQLQFMEESTGFVYFENISIFCI